MNALRGVARALTPGAVIIGAVGGDAAGEFTLAPVGDNPYVAAILRTGTPPVIDGRLDDPAWESAPAFDNFTQVDPIEGAPPTERTEVRLLFDSQNIYIGIRAYDSDPTRIVATQMRRDAELVSDDRMAVTIDTFLDRESGYFFEMNPAGARVDALLSNNRNVRREWDGIWYGKASIDELGWVMEIRIPTKTVSFDPTSSEWGLNVARTIRRKNEFVRWATPRRNSSVTRMADAGTLDGLEDLNQGVGLDIKPFLTLNYKPDRGSWDFDPGADLFYKLNPAVTASITINTDFAETEVDERIVNLTRFPVFFPEKRDFFLQDEGIFSFGGIRRSPLPFFSRRIGIVNGEQKDILAGVKITGRSEDFEFGALDVQMKHDDTLGDKNLGVLRAKQKLNAANSLGFIGTVGDPANPHADNGLFGFDYTYDSSNFDGNNNRLRGDLYFIHTYAGGETDAVNGGDGSAWGARLEYPNNPLNVSLFVGQIDESFDPALGFVQRSGEWEYFGRVEWQFRPEGAIRSIDVATRVQSFVDITDDKTNSSEWSLPSIDIEFNSGDEISFEIEQQRERLIEPFEISDGVTIPIGAYDFTRYRAFGSTSTGRPLSGNASVGWGEFYNGHREDYAFGVEWRASANFFTGVEYEQNEVTLPEGDFITRVLRLRANFAFSPDLALSNYVQYDNVSDEVGINSRLRWTVTPGSDIYLVLNQGLVVDDDDDLNLAEETTVITAKIAWTFRF